MGVSQIALNLPFWSYEEIQAGASLKPEWQIEDSLIPFFGDWHDVFCLDLLSGQIVFLNDARKVLFAWATPSEFMECLIQELQQMPEGEPRPTLVRGQFSEDLRNKVKAMQKPGTA